MKCSVQRKICVKNMCTRRETFFVFLASRFNIFKKEMLWDTLNCCVKSFPKVNYTWGHGSVSLNCLPRSQKPQQHQKVTRCAVSNSLGDGTAGCCDLQFFWFILFLFVTRGHLGPSLHLFSHISLAPLFFHVCSVSWSSEWCRPRHWKRSKRCAWQRALVGDKRVLGRIFKGYWMNGCPKVWRGHNLVFKSMSILVPYKYWLFFLVSWKECD